MTVNELLVKIGADVQDFTKGVKTTEDGLTSLTKYADTAAKALAGVAVVAGFKKLASEILDASVAAAAYANDLSNLAASTGQSEAAMQGWEVILNRVGLSQQDMAMGIKTLAKNLEEAKNPTSGAADRFRQLGIDITKVGTTDQALLAIAEASSTMANGLDKSAAMSDLLGRAGMKLIPAFEGGAGAIKRAADESLRMTQLNANQLAVLNQTDNAVNDFNLSWTRLSQQLGALFAPAVTAVSRLLTDLVSWLAQAAQSVDTALDTLALRFTHFALSVQRVGAVIFSTDILNVEAWKQAWADVQKYDEEAAKLIAQRRNPQAAPDTRSAPAPLQNSKELEAAQKASLDAQQAAAESYYKFDRQMLKESLSLHLATLAQRQQAYQVTAVQAAQFTEAAQAKENQKLRASLVNQIAEYQSWAAQRLATETAGSKERVALEGQVNNHLTGLWQQLAQVTIQGDTERIKSAMEVAKAKQDAANKEAEAGLQNFYLYAALAEREKQLNIDKATSYLALVQAQEGINVNSVAAYQRILDAKLAALQAEEAKELASIKITEEQKEIIRQAFAAKRLDATNQFQGQVAQVNQGQLSDVASVEAAKLNLMKATADQEFVLFRNVDALRQQRTVALTAQYQADLAAAKDNAEKKLAIETNYQAALKGVSKEFPTFLEQQMTSIQQSMTYTWSTLTSSFSGALAGMIQGTATFAQFLQQAMNTILQASINLGLQLLTNWIMAEVQRAATTQTTNAVIVASNAAAATTTTSLWGAAASGIGASLLGIGAAAKSLWVDAIMPALAAVGTAIMGFLTAVAAAMKATIFGIPVGVAILVGVGAIAAALAGMKAIKFASGGIVTGPTMGLVGEAGPEAIIPLSQLPSLMNQSSGEQTVMVQLDGRTLMKYTTDNLPSLLRLKGVPA